MIEDNLDLEIERLGECKIPSPVSVGHFTKDNDNVLFRVTLPDIEAYLASDRRPPAFEQAGPREKIYFDPSKLKCGIVTCGGLCPGLNDVIRSIVLSLHYHYGVKTVFGFPYGYEGLTYRYGHTPLELTPKAVQGIHEQGGTILGSSRGPQDTSEMVDTLERMNVGVLFTIGGDGTLKGAKAISEEVKKRGLKISVIGIPKTIDNDISYVQKSFGFETAVSEAKRVIYSAHSEALGARNGIGLVKLMGRESGFISSYATLACNDVNFCLIPESPFTLQVFLEALKKRLQERSHAVIVVAEGAGQDILKNTGDRDASGNIRFEDVGLFLRGEIASFFEGSNMEISMKYIDPSYIIRSVPANASDAAFSLLLGQNAVHAAMTGRTNMVVGTWMNRYTHVPISLAVSKRKKIDPDGWMWASVLTATGQPRNMLSPEPQ
jgi:6-phosphofructokinase 1